MTLTKCPFCSALLVKGYIKTTGEVLAWTPDNVSKNMLSTRGHVQKEEMKLGEYSFLKGGKVDAYKCSVCNKIIIDAKPKE